MTSHQTKVVGLGDSLATTSSSAAALRIALEGSEEAGAETELVEIANLDLPMYNPDNKEIPETARTFSESVHRADGLV